MECQRFVGESRPARTQTATAQRGRASEFARLELLDELERQLTIEIVQREHDRIKSSSRQPAVAVRRGDLR